MIRRLTSCIGLPLILLFFFTAEHALSDDSISAVERSKNTALIFFGPETSADQRRQIVTDADFKAEPEFVENVEKFVADKGSWFVANVSPEEARKQVAVKKYGDFAYVVENSVVYLFDAPCDDSSATALPTTGDTPNPNITRMGGPLQGTVPNRRVWIIDSGVFTMSDRLNIDFNDAASCQKSGPCKSANGHQDRVEDDIGHGTFIAGIIGGMDIGEGSIIGMLPGAKIVPIKMFDINNAHAQPESNLDSFMKAVQWVLNDAPLPAKPGDVINISFGMRADFGDLIERNIAYSDVETYLHQLADKGVKISIAAGNFEKVDAHGNPGEFADIGGYVELLSPQRLGGYKPSSGGGAIVTVSGIDKDDKFWPGSFFGNGARPGVAAPSFNIQSLWKNKQNACTGTSFATAHISGALLQSNGIDLTYDRDSTNDVDTVNDIIVTCKKTDGKCIIN